MVMGRRDYGPGPTKCWTNERPPSIIPLSKATVHVEPLTPVDTYFDRTNSTTFDQSILALDYRSKCYVRYHSSLRSIEGPPEVL